MTVEEEEDDAFLFMVASVVAFMATQFYKVVPQRLRGPIKSFPVSMASSLIRLRLSLFLILDQNLFVNLATTLFFFFPV